MGLTESTEASSSVGHTGNTNTANGNGHSSKRERGCFGFMDADTSAANETHPRSEPRARFRANSEDDDDDEDDDGPLRDDTAYASSSDDDGVVSFGGRIRAPPTTGPAGRGANAASSGAAHRRDSEASDSEEEAERDRARREIIQLRAEAARQAAAHAASEAKALERKRIRAAQRNGTFDFDQPTSASPPHTPSPVPPPPSSSLTSSPKPSKFAAARVAAATPTTTSPVASSSPRVELNHSITETHTTPTPLASSHQAKKRTKKHAAPTATAAAGVNGTSSSTSSPPITRAPTPSATTPPASPNPPASTSSSRPQSPPATSRPPPSLPPVSHLPAIGTMRKLGNHGEQKSCWSTIDANGFKIRLGPNYAKTSTKAPSLDAIYECIGCDVFKGRQSNVGSRLELPPSPGVTSPVTLPGVLIINCQLPTAFDVSVAFYFIISSATRTLLSDWHALCARRLSHAGGHGDGDVANQSPAVRAASLVPDTTPSYPPTIDCQMNALYHFERYINNTQPGIRRKLKGIVRIQNVSEVKLGFIERPLVNSNNGTPFLLTESPSFHQGANYFEVDIDVNKFSMLARNGMEGFQDRINTMVLDYAWTVEASADTELPERLLACVRLCRPDLTTPRTLP